MGQKPAPAARVLALSVAPLVILKKFQGVSSSSGMNYLDEEKERCQFLSYACWTSYEACFCFYIHLVRILKVLALKYYLLPL
ncbi:hypothetical protein F0562_013117 [Nyssa sinensis]|uniref:Uncharacterized protein n=1 Tax=Nyssa sinensis TaxID=561372 RepID=A0A5J4ZYJ5_9ASTE|nr:hypothetical protein F0562_013117 [Nyssa sinensis]